MYTTHTYFWFTVTKLLIGALMPEIGRRMCMKDMTSKKQNQLIAGSAVKFAFNIVTLQWLSSWTRPSLSSWYYGRNSEAVLQCTRLGTHYWLKIVLTTHKHQYIRYQLSLYVSDGTARACHKTQSALSELHIAQSQPMDCCYMSVELLGYMTVELLGLYMQFELRVCGSTMVEWIRHSLLV